MPCIPFRIHWDGEDILNLVKQVSKGKITYEDDSVRFLEAETAVDTKILPLSTWYALPKIDREYIIATRLARMSIDNIQSRYYRGKAK